MNEWHGFDVARKVRGVMGEERITASDLSRTYGGAVSYWTRRMMGAVELTFTDLEKIAAATRSHVAILSGGQAPDGWEPPAAPSGGATLTGKYGAGRHLRAA